MNDRPAAISSNYILHNGEWTHPSRLVGQLQGEVPKQKEQPALDSPPPRQPSKRKRVAGRRPKIGITIIGFRRRELDDDNFVSGCKPLRDAIARSLGLDDSQRFIRWQYQQIETRGREGTAVVIEPLNNHR